ncbi:MFS transporter [Deinococcus radiotolerans]|uniref:MFS transporter n=1 Tax=Deinococcus radiotolerans TaxID=1309407 RepID=A0ABQ2FIN7_9DEIO|nr:MFS transporter [Deinococcus radiotolerans]GGK92510.1 hypothetical protein GCM10010844_08770 [Deinococcus radiotolerans]
MTTPLHLQGLRAYALLWAGQGVGALGLGLTAFAQAVWLWDQTHSVTASSLVTLATTLPAFLAAPWVGALVDRWHTHLRRVLALGDGARLLLALLTLGLLHAGQLTPALLYALLAAESVFTAFHWPAASAAARALLRPDEYTRGSGVQMLALSASGVLAAPLGALLYPRVGLGGVVALDVLGSVLALGSVLLLRLPARTGADTPLAAPLGLRDTLRRGLRFLAARRPLLTLQLVLTGGYFVQGVYAALLTPLVLSLEAGGQGRLAQVSMAGGGAALLGGALLSVWRGWSRQTPVFVAGWTLVLLGVLGTGLSGAPGVWAACAALIALGIAAFGTANQAIWLQQTPLEIQGTVFALRRMLGMSTLPLAAALSGPLVDRVLAPQVNLPLLGSGTSGAIRLLLVTLSVLGLLLLAGVVRSGRLRGAEPNPAPALDRRPDGAATVRAAPGRRTS